MRYIDADALKETIVSNVYPVADVFNSRDYGMFWTGGIEKAIDQQPTADVRENIHAKKIISGGEHDGATCWFECSHCHGTVDIEDAYCKHCGAVLEYEPTADVVEVVRCKDCKYWDNATKWAVCTYWSADPYEQASTEKNDFCSYGERADT